MNTTSGVGPNIGRTGEDFFQSDRDIQEAARRASKQQLPPETVGNPWKLPAKILSFESHPTEPDVAYLALANATLREVNLKVLGK